MKGIWTALVTPFTESGELDLPAYRALLKDQLEAGVAGVVPNGTTGESPTLTLAEKKTLIEIALSELKGTNIGVMAGTGGNSTRETVEFSKWASDQGVEALLVVTPYYNKPTQAGLEAHFRAVADGVACPIVLYNVPGRTGVSLTPETIVKLARHPKIQAIKEATGNVAFTSEILDQLSQHGLEMSVLSGDDATFLALLSVGARGVISVSSNLFPREMIEIERAFESGNIEQARKLHQFYYPLFRDLFIESNPAPIKAALAEVGLCTPTVRLPLCGMSEASLEKLEQSLERCKIARRINL